MSGKNSFIGYCGVNVKQEFSVYDGDSINQCGCGKKLPGPFNIDDICSNCIKVILVGIKNKVIRLRYPRGASSNLKYIKDASEELQCMAALLISGLIPAGVFADKLQEEFPEHEQAANILREWQENR